MQKTQKAERFFKERISLSFQGPDGEGNSKGELNNISNVITIEELIDKEGKQFEKRKLKFMVFNIEEELLSDRCYSRSQL